MKKTFSLFLLVSVMCFSESAFLSQVEEGQKGILKVVHRHYDSPEYKEFTQGLQSGTRQRSEILAFLIKGEKSAFQTFTFNKFHMHFDVEWRKELCSFYLNKYHGHPIVLECAAMIYEESNLVEKALPLYEMLMSKKLMSLDSYGNYASCLLQKKGHDQDSMKKVWNIIKEWQNRLPEKDQIFFIPKREHEALREVDFLGATYDFLFKKIKEHNHIDLLLEIQNFKREEANPTLPKILITMAYQQHILPTELHKVCVVNTGETILSCKSSKKEFDPNNIEGAQLKQYLEAFNSYIEKQKEFLEIIKKNVDDLLDKDPSCKNFLQSTHPQHYQSNQLKQEHYKNWSRHLIINYRSSLIALGQNPSPILVDLAGKTDNTTLDTYVFSCLPLVGSPEFFQRAQETRTRIYNILASLFQENQNILSYPKIKKWDINKLTSVHYKEWAKHILEKKFDLFADLQKNADSKKVIEIHGPEWVQEMTAQALKIMIEGEDL